MVNKIQKSKPKRATRSAGAAFNRLVRIMAKLRAPGGCPWDRKQTHRSLLPYLIEETYELKDALLSRSPDRMREEMGDLLLQIVFHAQIATERDRFSVAEVADGISDKLVRRHPHVFGARKKRLSSKQVLANWERIKLAEKPGKSRTLLEGVPKSMPALLKAYRVQEKVAQYGFDWQHAEGALAKLREEVEEFHDALRLRQHDAVSEELGDLLFTLVNLARHVRVDPETALNQTNKKFVRRFEAVEKSLKRQGFDPAEVGVDVLDKEWQAVKAKERVPKKRKTRK
jgi:tetrapyrrole methylase family protein/MazG family protein